MPIHPGKDESQSEWMSRCMSEMSQSEDRSKEQNVAACMQMWRDKDKKMLKVAEPEEDESKDDFMERCIDEGGDESACELAWEERSAPPIVHKQKATNGGGMEFILSDETADRMGDVIISNGWVTENFRNNPVALFNHRSDFPIGTWVDVRVKDKSLRGHLVLAPKGISPRIDEIRGLVEANVLRAVSVGFKPIESRPLPGEKGGFAFTKSELVEVSLVSIPANPNALAVAKSLNLSSEIRNLVFREHVDESTRRKSVSARVRAENGSDRTRASNGKHAETRPESRGFNMLLSKRVENAETFLVQLQDQLTAHLENGDDANVTDEQMAITSDLNTKIAMATRNRDNLKASEELLAKNAEAHKNALSTTAYTPNTNGHGPRPFGMPVKKINPLDYLIRQGIISAFAHSRRINIDDARRLAGYGDDECTKAFTDYAMKAATAPAMTTVTGWAAELVETV